MAQQLAGGERVKLLAILKADARRPGSQRGLLDHARHELETERRIHRNHADTMCGADSPAGSTARRRIEGLNTR